MALNTSRSAWSMSRQSLRSILTNPTRRSVVDNIITRQRTSLEERDDLLNASETDEDIELAKPRWAYTPPQLKAAYGFQLKEPLDPRNSIWKVNEDPAVLDAFYDRFLGGRGSKMLPDELKWLAVTHKSFDQGRRGFNVKLAYFGRQILVHEIVSLIMLSPIVVNDHLDDPWRRAPFKSPAVNNVNKLTMQRPADYMTLLDLAHVGQKVGLEKVMRWKPKMPQRLVASGIDMVYATTLFAIVGAVSLQHGGKMAGEVAREKVLARMPVRNRTMPTHNVN